MPDGSSNSRSPRKPVPKKTKKVSLVEKIRTRETKLLYRACASRESPSHFGGQPLETWAGELWSLAHTIAKKVLPGRQTEKNVQATTHLVVLAMCRGIREGM